MRQNPRAMTVVAIVFWISVGLLLYTHLGYAALLAALASLRRPRAAPPGAHAGRVGDRGRVRRAGRDRRPGGQPACARLPGGPARGHRLLRRLARRDRRRGPARPAPTSCSSFRAAARSALRTRPSQQRPGRDRRLLRCQRALGAGRAEGPGGSVRRRARRVRVRPGRVRQRARHQPGGGLLALRDGDPRSSSPGCAR